MLNLYMALGAVATRYNPLINYKWVTLPISSDYVTDGIELVTNGGFDSNDLSSFSSSTYAINSIVNNELEVELNTNGGYGFARVQFSAEIGSSYIVKIIGRQGTGTSVRVLADSGIIIGASPTTIGELSYVEVGIATSETPDIRLQVYGSISTNGYFDNISVQKVIQEPNKRYLRGSGSSKSHIPLDTGGGIAFNGSNQSIPISLPTADPLHFYKFDQSANENIYQYLATPPAIYYLGQVDGSGIFEAKTYSNVIFSKFAFSETQLAYLDNYPEKFLYYDGAILKSEILNQSEIDNVVFYAPMRDKDNYVRDYANYSELNMSNNFNSNFDNGIVNWGGLNGQFSVINNKLKIIKTGSNDVIYMLVKPIIGKTYIIKPSVTHIIGTESTQMRFGGGIFYLNSQTVPFLHTVTTSTCDIRAGYTAGDEVDIEFEMIEVMGVYPITNYTPSCNVGGLPYGLQSIYTKMDSLGTILGTDFNSLQLHGDEIPALPIDMTDTELWGDGSVGFQIGFVIEREVATISSWLMATNVSGKGMELMTGKSWNADQSTLYLYDGTSQVNISTNLDENPHFVLFTVLPTTMFMSVDGVDGTPVAHNFVPSGLNFKDSTRPSPTGNLKLFEIHKKIQDTTVLYQRAKRKMASQGITI